MAFTEEHQNKGLPPAPNPPRTQHGVRLRLTCDGCQDAKSRCSREQPCYRCKHMEIQCIYSPRRRVGRPRRSQSKEGSNKSTAGHEVRPPKQKRVERPGSSGGTSGETESSASRSMNMTPTRLSVTDLSPTTLTPTNMTPMAEYNQSPIHHYSNSSGAANHDVDMQMASLHHPTAMDCMHLPFTDPMFGFTSPDLEVANFSSDTFHQSLDHNLNLITTAEDTAPVMSLPEPTRTIEAPALSAPTLSSQSSLSTKRRDYRTSPSLQHSSDSSGSESRQPLVTQSNPEQGAKFCECYRQVLQRLLEFDEMCTMHGKGFAIDMLMTLQQKVQDQTARTLECGNCFKRPELLMLLAMAIDNLACLFDAVSCSRPRSNHIEWTGSAPKSVWSNGSLQSGSRQSGLFALFESRALMAGEMEISSRDKLAFLKQLLRGRISSLAALLQQIQNMMAKAPQNALMASGLALVREGRRRLNTVVGRVELLDG